MPQVRAYVDGRQAGVTFQRVLGRNADRTRRTVRQSAQDIADEIQTQGWADISKAGRFGSRWVQGLHVTVTEGGGSIRVSVTHDVPYWTVFEKGKVIQGKPMLWIPLSFAEDAQGVWARNYPGHLFKINRDGDRAPLLLSSDTGEPKYFGKSEVTIPKKFHLREISKTAMLKLPLLFRYHRAEG